MIGRILAKDFTYEFCYWLLDMYKNCYTQMKKPFPTMDNYRNLNEKKKLTQQNKDFLRMLINGGEL